MKPTSEGDITPADAYRAIALIMERTPLMVLVTHHHTVRLLRPSDLPLDGHRVGIPLAKDELIFAYCLLAAMDDAGDLIVHGESSQECGKQVNRTEEA